MICALEYPKDSPVSHGDFYNEEQSQAAWHAAVMIAAREQCSVAPRFDQTDLLDPQYLPEEDKKNNVPGKWGISVNFPILDDTLRCQSVIVCFANYDDVFPAYALFGDSRPYKLYRFEPTGGTTSQSFWLHDKGLTDLE